MTCATWGIHLSHSARYDAQVALSRPLALQLVSEDRAVVLARLPSLPLSRRSVEWAAEWKVPPRIVWVKTGCRFRPSFSFVSLRRRSNSDSCFGRTMKPLSVGLPQLEQ